MKFLSNFIKFNRQELDYIHKASDVIPKLINSSMGCCLANLQVAVLVIKGMEANEETKTIFTE